MSLKDHYGYKAGAEARSLGVPRAANPYKVWMDNYHRWFRGWDEWLPPMPAQSEPADPVEIIRNLLTHAVQDREQNDDCIAAVEAAEAFLREREQ